MTKKSKADKILDDFDKALEQMDEDINALIEGQETSYCQGWKDGLATGMLLIALIFGTLCYFLHL